MIKRTSPQPGIPADLATEYATLLEHHPVCHGEVADISELPGSKEAIKAAILARARHADPGLMTAIKGAFCCLSYWQSGVGPDRIGPNLTDIAAAKNTDYRELIKKFEAGEEWDAIKKAEWERLTAEFDKHFPGVD